MASKSASASKKGPGEHYPSPWPLSTPCSTTSKSAAGSPAAGKPTAPDATVATIASPRPARKNSRPSAGNGISFSRLSIASRGLPMHDKHPITPDWSALVREHLRPLDLPALERQEVVAELAAHLADFYEEQLKNGRTESEAHQKTRNEVVEWRPLARNIQRAKFKEGIMNTRTKQLWLPSLVSLATAMLSLMFLTFFPVQPRLLYAHHAGTMLNLTWLAALPLCGAAGAYLSCRAG